MGEIASQFNEIMPSEAPSQNGKTPTNFEIPKFFERPSIWQIIKFKAKSIFSKKNK